VVVTESSLTCSQRPGGQLYAPAALPLRKEQPEPIGQEDCETSRLQYFLDNRLIDGSEVARLARRSPFTTQEDAWYSFLLDAESTPGGQLRPEGLGQLKSPVTSSGI
jgi:hypothetical protein